MDFDAEIVLATMCDSQSPGPDVEATPGTQLFHTLKPAAADTLFFGRGRRLVPPASEHRTERRGAAAGAYFDGTRASATCSGAVAARACGHAADAVGCFGGASRACADAA